MDRRLLNQRYKRRTAALAILLALSALSFGGVLFYNLTELSRSWVSYIRETTPRVDSLARIHQAVGYGGLIHNYNAYLFSPDAMPLERLQADVEKTQTSLGNYERLSLNGIERQALQQFKTAFEYYRTHIIRLQSGDSVARVARDYHDDQTAIDALLVLQAEYERLNTSNQQAMREQLDWLINLLLIGLLSIPVIGIWAYRHMELLENLAQHILARHQMQRKLEATEEQIDEANKRSEEYKYLAYRCALTRIPNRQAFNEAASKALDAAHVQQEKLAVLYVDVDDFKQINDRYGHKAGDQVLTEIASRLAKVLRDDDLVARIGGDEFAILIFGRDALNAKDQLAERILEVLRRPFDAIEHGLKVSCSVGGAIGPDHGQDVDSLLKAADSRMYAIKRSGKDGAMIE